MGEWKQGIFLFLLEREVVIRWYRILSVRRRFLCLILSGSWGTQSREHQQHHRAWGFLRVSEPIVRLFGLEAFSRIHCLLFPASPGVAYTRRWESLRWQGYGASLLSHERHRYHSWHFEGKITARSHRSWDGRCGWYQWDHLLSAPAAQRVRVLPESR